MKNVYVVTEGSYSDYRICGVFDSKELAEKFTKSFEKDLMEIEEYTLNPFLKEINEKYKAYFVRMTSEGKCLDVRLIDSFSCLDPKYSFDVKKNLYCSVFAEDEKHAIKIVNEYRIQILASNTWGKVVY